MFKTLFTTSLFAACATAQESNGYTKAEALISRQLSADAYCGKDATLTHVYEGSAAGFVATKVLYDSATDTQGFVGYLPSDNSIYVVFRGSSSIANWITNFQTTQSTYTKWPTCNCKVHDGFQKAVNTVYNTALTEVKRLKSLHSAYTVKTTGHSLGGALAQLTAMALIADGIPTTMINFGQPRVGDTTYAAFSHSKLANQFRVVHYKDTVPHIPTQTPIDYHHTAYEMYEDSTGSVKQCDVSGEDPTCADQWNLLQQNADDHMYYLGYYMGCGNSADLFLQ